MGPGNYAGALLGASSGNQYSDNSLNPYLAEQMRQQQIQAQQAWFAQQQHQNQTQAPNTVLLLLDK